MPAQRLVCKDGDPYRNVLHPIGESEDQTQNEACNPHLKRVREVHHIEPKPLQTTRATMAVAKRPEKPYYCRENQSNERRL